MSVESYIPGKDTISVTQAAQRHFMKQLAGQHARAVRISVKESGCTGYVYVMDLVNEPGSEDMVLELEQGLKIFVDSKALPVIRGTEIDFGLDGVNQVVKFNNPNAKDFCGCGESFSIN
ncbi:HesB/IscA family protein [Gynuella sunshinyii]|uniref:Core domain-containing protein n=1 Tax=Gynuella sunshinyii YC6258 TaxID=1445510 RepID=A0A0C5VU09_9GAMM|nr:iron-sulfur cluster assembly accessory protein [Gynuella sunshinyii]AJQ96763.1 hypothetical protein YC6258_04731 [Gynuella sunshinyii YC6258]